MIGRAGPASAQARRRRSRERAQGSGHLLGVLRTVLMVALLAGLADPAPAQVFRRAPVADPPVRPAPANLPPSEADIWPYPAPDPKAWWDDKWPKAPEAADPLGGRRLGRNERPASLENGVDASTYRLWGLMPLQWQVLRGDEMILEVWVRPARSVRQSVVRITVRRDGDAFVQARAGLACCEAAISRRVAFDAQLPPGSAAKFLALRSHPMWSAPRDVRVDEGGGAVDAVCVDGVSYDLTLVVPGRARAIRRACDGAEVGQAADALEAALGAAYGREPRFDALYPGGVSFAADRRAYEDLIKGGGRLKPVTQARTAPPGAEGAPPPEDAPAATAP